MDWFTALMPLTSDANLEDPLKANVRGDGRTKFAVSNWTAYSNMKAAMANAGHEGSIFAGKHKEFQEGGVEKMIGCYKKMSY